MNRRIQFALVAGCAAFALAVPTGAAVAEPPKGADVVPNSYIVTAKDSEGMRVNSVEVADRTTQVVTQARQIGVNPTRVYKNFGGYSATLTADQLSKLKADANLTVLPNRVHYLPGLAPGEKKLEAAKPQVKSTTRQMFIADLRNVDDNNINQAINDWSTQKMVILEYAKPADRLMHTWASYYNRMDGESWTLGYIDAKAATSIGLMEMMVGSNASAMVAIRDGQMLGTFTGSTSSSAISAWINDMKAKKPEPKPEPTTAPPTSEPPTTEPPTSEPPTSKPATSKPATSKPATSKPATSKPVTSKPVTSKPVSSKPVTTEPNPGPVGPQKNAPWHLDMVDNKQGKTDTSFAPPNYGKGVTVYVTDTGVDGQHEEFAGRLLPGFSAYNGEAANTDGQGHGTHVASTAAGKKYGLAKEANIVPVKIFNNEGKSSDEAIFGGLDWLASNVKLPAVVNASWGDPDAFDTDKETQKRVNKLIDQGVTWVNAAGNQAKDACKGSPWGMKNIIVVGATNKDLEFEDWYSNNGSCVSILAPGTDVIAAKAGTKSDTKSDTGTSMACPVVTGAAAIYLSSHPNASHADVKKALVNNASSGITKKVKSGTTDRFLYVGQY